MTGLHNERVRVVRYTPEWAKLGEIVCRNLLDAAGSMLIDVQHVGSTSVPGLSSKPIIDLVAAITDRSQIPEVDEIIAPIGYVHRVNSNDGDEDLFIMESEPGIRTIHLHVVNHGGTRWNNYLRFRDVLIANETIRREYEELKQSLAAKYLSDRKRYTAGKHDFIANILS